MLNGLKTRSIDKVALAKSLGGHVALVKRKKHIITWARVIIAVKNVLVMMKRKNTAAKIMFPLSL